MTAVLAAIGIQTRPVLAVVDVPSDVTGYGSSGVAANITTGLVVATPSGGLAPYTYSWAQTGSSPYTWTISAATAASTSFTCNSLGPGNTADTVFTCTVTDAAGATAKGTVSAFANNGQPYDSRVAGTGTKGATP